MALIEIDSQEAAFIALGLLTVLKNPMLNQGQVQTILDISLKLQEATPNAQS